MDWHGYVKDQLDITSKPKAFLRIRSCSIREDLLTSTTSSFNCLEVADNISNGDILLVTDETGKKMYLGVISSIEEQTISTYQIQHIYAGTWLYDLPNIVGVGDDKLWSFEKYDYLIDKSKSYEKWSTSDLPTLDDLEELESLSSTTYKDSDISLKMGIGDYYTAKCTTFVYSEERKKVNMWLSADNGGILYVNGSKISTYLFYDKSSKTSNVDPTKTEVTIRKGWNKIEVVYINEDGTDGFLVTIEGTHLSSYFDKLTSQYTSDVTSLEGTFAKALNLYASGQLRDSSYIDPIVKQRLNDIQIQVGSNTVGAFTTQNDNYTCDMEQMIYDLYNKYQIMLDFEIPYEGDCFVTITKNNIDSLKIGNNTNSIVDISPVTELEETNRLVIYNKDGTYRTTYAVKSDGTRIKEPSSTANRFGVVNTKIVFSDDDDDTLIEANLPEIMYNHKLTFTLRLLPLIENKINYTKMVDVNLRTADDKNLLVATNEQLLVAIPVTTNYSYQTSLYSYDDFILGMPLQVWKDTSYFSTILTGRSLTKNENAPVSTIEFTCGTVRTSLTEKLLIKFGVQR